MTTPSSIEGDRKRFTIYLCHACGWIQGEEEPDLACARCGEPRSSVETLEVVPEGKLSEARVRWNADVFNHDMGWGCMNHVRPRRWSEIAEAQLHAISGWRSRAWSAEAQLAELEAEQREREEAARREWERREG
jgi:rubredoxin